MTVELTEEQYGTAWRALAKIAHGRGGPNNKRLSRDTVVTIAREACDAIGWRYDANAVKPFYDGEGLRE